VIVNGRNAKSGKPHTPGSKLELRPVARTHQNGPVYSFVLVPRESFLDGVVIEKEHRQIVAQSMEENYPLSTEVEKFEKTCCIQLEIFALKHHIKGSLQQLVIKMPAGKEMILDVNDVDIISDIKHKIWDKGGPQTSEQVLTWNGFQLQGMSVMIQCLLSKTLILLDQGWHLIPSLL
jgi:hypothetical protein